MLIKISGVRDPEKIEKLIVLNPAYMAFDFRADSERYVGEVDHAIYSKIPKKIRRVGIFCNNDPIHMIAVAGRFSLNALQLEGDESVADCEMIGAEGMELIKVIDKNWQFDKYEGVCNKFLVRKAELVDLYHGKTPIIMDRRQYECQNVYALDVMDEEF